MSQIRLQDLAKGKGPLSAKQILQVRRWLQDDWESHDFDRDLIRLIGRLLDSIRAQDLPAGNLKFKIRDKSTGLYSSGGYRPGWSEGGKTWDRLAEVRAHLKMMERGSQYCMSMKVPPSWEIVEFQLERIGQVKSARSLLKG